jgi:ketosteroid isomerase-like protein
MQATIGAVSADHTESVLRALEAFNRRDIEGMLAATDAAIEFYPSEDFLDAGPFRGGDGMRALFGLLGEAFDGLTMEAEDVVATHDKVAVLIHQSGRGKSSGALVDNRYTLVFAFREGKVVRIDAYRDHAEALAAAGARGAAAGAEQDSSAA